MKVALAAERHEFDWARFKRIDRLLIKFVLGLLAAKIVRMID
jgi:hypothetical protein